MNDTEKSTVPIFGTVISLRASNAGIPTSGSFHQANELLNWSGKYRREMKFPERFLNGIDGALLMKIKDTFALTRDGITEEKARWNDEGSERKFWKPRSNFS